MKCAGALNDGARVQRAAIKAINESVEPQQVLYQVLIDHQKGDFEKDAEYVHALKKLRGKDPDNPLWAQLLGEARFDRGSADLVSGVDEMMSSIELGKTNVMAYALASESARRLGRVGDAIEMLEKGLVAYPNDLGLMNNLAFALSTSAGRAEDAVKMVPDLMARGGNNPHVLDTVAVVYIAAGRLDEAEAVLRELGQVLASKGQDPAELDVIGAALWLRRYLHQARIELLRGDADTAHSTVKGAFARTGDKIGDRELYDSDNLLKEIEKRLLGLQQAKTPTEQSSRSTGEISLENVK
jgi:tetratricopeptide (TPR) repeat protein